MTVWSLAVHGAVGVSVTPLKKLEVHITNIGTLVVIDDSVSAYQKSITSSDPTEKNTHPSQWHSKERMSRW